MKSLSSILNEIRPVSTEKPAQPQPVPALVDPLGFSLLYIDECIHMLDGLYEKISAQQDVDVETADALKDCYNTLKQINTDV